MIIYPNPIISVTDDVTVKHYGSHADVWHFEFFYKTFYGPWV